MKQGHPIEYVGKISVRIGGWLKKFNFFPSNALDFSIFSENHKVSPGIFGIDLLTFIMYHNFWTVFVCSVIFSSDLIISKAAKSFGERPSLIKNLHETNER